MGDSGVRSYVVFRTDVFVEPAPSVHNDEWRDHTIGFGRNKRRIV